MAESITVVTLLVRALECVNLQRVFAPDPYESRRTALPGSRLVKVLVIYQMIKSNKLRGLIRAIEEHQGLQTALGGEVERNTLSNALQQRELEQMIEAWMLVRQRFGPWVARLGKRFARLAIVDGSLLKLSLAAFAWAEYRKQKGGAKMHAIVEWERAIPQQLIFTVGKVHDLKGAAQMKWAAHWTYVFDRGYFCYRFLAGVLGAGAHFVVRFKEGVHYTIVERRVVGVAPATAHLRLRSDWTVSLPGWPGVLMRLVSYQLPDGKLIRVLTDRFDLTAMSIAQLYKERWTIENWWKWLKYMFKVKEPLGRSEQAMPVQIVGAFVTDLLLRAFKQSSSFTGSHYEFVARCQEVSLTSVDQIPEESALRKALEAIWRLFSSKGRYLQLVA
jgi:hypothetical protein